MKTKKENIRSVISGILSFLLSLCITMLVIMLCLDFTTFQANALNTDMNDSFFRQTQQSLTEDLKELIPPSGLPDTIFDDLISVSMIKKDATQVVQNTLGGIKEAYNSDTVRQLFMNRFTQYADSQGIDVQSTNLDSLADSCAAVYERQITVPFLQTYAPFRLMFDKVFTYSVICLTALSIVILLILFHIHRFKHRAVRFSIYSLLASALMILPIPVYLLIQGEYKNLNITPEQFHTLFISLAQKSLWGLIIGGTAVGLLGILLLPLVGHMKDKLTMSGHSHS